jgi:hypothetical protein
LIDPGSRIDDKSAAHKDVGTVELIVRRPAVDRREVVVEAVIDEVEGLVGDTWRSRGSRSTLDRSADPQAQITVMSARAAARFAGAKDRWPLAGDQFYVDLDIGEDNLPAGSLIAIGEAVLQVSAKPHTGCAKFSNRFGREALQEVSSPAGRAQRLRGMNTSVVSGGVVRVGDDVRVLERGSAARP